jgi:septal ring factor EnvC (AmiA/AmiB activator)
MTDKMTPAEALAPEAMIATLKAAAIQCEAFRLFGTASAVRVVQQDIATLAAQLQAQAAEVERLHRACRAWRLNVESWEAAARKHFARAEAAEARETRLREAVAQAAELLDADDARLVRGAQIASSLRTLLNPPVDPATINAGGE